MMETLADRLNRIIFEQKITKREFARRIGVGETYVYVLTRGGRSNNLNRKISPMLARVIGMEFGYDPDWILYGRMAEGKLRQAVMEQVEKLSPEELLSLNEFFENLKKSK